MHDCFLDFFCSVREPEYQHTFAIRPLKQIVVVGRGHILLYILTIILINVNYCIKKILIVLIAVQRVLELCRNSNSAVLLKYWINIILHKISTLFKDSTVHT